MQLTFIPPKVGLTKKMVLAMKLTTILLLAACLQLSARGISQNISLSVKNAPLEKVLNEIEKQTGFNFIYGQGLISKADRVSIEVKNETLEKVLDVVLKNQSLAYKISEKYIVLSPKTSGVFQPPVTTPSNFLPPPPITVRGRVVNENGEPVIASVLVKGTNNGASTNADGYFELQNVDENATLIITGVSIAQTVEIKVNSKTNIGDIITQRKVVEGKEIIVKTNYWETKQRLNPGNISKVTAKEIERQPVSNPLQTLQGLVPGLEIVQQTGVPGGNFQVRIRGTNSIANGNDPLYIVDGVPYMSSTMSFTETSANILIFGVSPLNSINPADIESIEVLKDADATAIYGSRGANGVILITTKRGKAGKTKVNFNLYSGVGKVASKMNLLNRQQYLQMRREAFANDNVTPTTANARDLLVWDTTRHTNWQKQLLGGTANYLDAQVSFSGGNQYTQFLFGGGYHRETTVFPGDNSDQRTSAHFSVTNSTPNQKLKTFVSINYSANYTDLISQDLTSRALFLPPNAPALYDANGDLNWNGWDASGLFENPVAYLKRKYEANTNTLIGNANIGYAILRNLEIKTSFGYTHTAMDSYNLTPISSLAPATGLVNTTGFSNSKFQNWIVEPQANWKPQLGKNKFDILIGTQFLNQVREGLAQTATGFSSEALMKNIAAGPNRTLGSNYYAQYRYTAMFGRINYNFENKYIINLTGRRDGSSRFGPGKQFANFGAVGTAWVFSNEDFIQEALPFLSYGKLRVSYGTSGNDQLPDYQYLDTYTSSAGPYQGVIGLTPARLNNPFFAWEINRKFEAGLELGFANDRILTSFSYYRNRSSNQLVGEPLPPTTGFTSIQNNFPATVQNTGLEIEVNTTNIQRKDLNWTTSFNISVPRNKLLSFPNIEASPAYANAYAIGEPLSIFKAYRYLGVDPTTGLYQFEDVNGNGSFNQADRQTIKFIGPDFFGGLQNSLRYKDFQLDILFQFVKQEGRNYIYAISSAPGSMINQPDFVLGRWQKPGDNADLQRFSQASAATTYGLLSNSDRSVTDASFIRLKNLSFSWSLPQNWRNKIHAENASLFIRGQNLLTITNFKGLDPETQSLYSLPPLKVWAIGINLTF